MISSRAITEVILEQRGTHAPDTTSMALYQQRGLPRVKTAVLGIDGESEWCLGRILGEKSHVLLENDFFVHAGNVNSSMTS